MLLVIGILGKCPSIQPVHYRRFSSPCSILPTSYFVLLRNLVSILDGINFSVLHKFHIGSEAHLGSYVSNYKGSLRWVKRSGIFTN
jgi:hypothetical protein